MATLESLQAKIQKLQKQADALVAKQSSGVIEKIRELMVKHDLTTADIGAPAGGKKRRPKPGAKSAVVTKASAAKYRHPKTGAEWTGHGRAPTWIADVKDRSKFLIVGAAEATTAVTAGTASKAKTAVKKTSKGAGATSGKGQRKGPQPAMYRDPKSGATWSGRGRTPAWLAGAKDRTKFLIDGTGAITATASKTSEPKAEATKAVARKAAAKKVVAENVPLKKVAAKKATAKEATNQVGPTARKTVAAKKPPAANKKVAVKKASAVPVKRTSTAPAKKVTEVAVKRPTVKKAVATKATAVKESASAAVVAANAPDVAAPELAVATGA